MFKSRALVYLSFVAVLLSTVSYAVTPDRIQGDLMSGPKVTLRGNVHGLARPEFDQGRADSNRMIQGITLAFRPSPAQQKDLDQFLTDLANPKSPHFHKYLTPAQFGARFGMSRNDIAKITGWLQSEGFTNISVANGRNQISFDGTVGLVESVFAIEMHTYLVDGEIHLANATEPSVPSALAGTVLAVGNLNNFSPKPRAKVQPHLTSYVSGNHFLSPADFATIYDVNALYSGGITGSGQKIAIIGQSSVSATDLSNFRARAGLPTSSITIMPVPSGSTLTKCSGDEGESALDLEWSGGVAKSATIVFVAASLGIGDKCSARNNNVWQALQYAVDHNVAPFISISYGACESANGQAFAQQVQSWAQQGIAQGQTIVSASGDQGAADCESNSSTSATTGLAVEMPASIPEVTGAGGNNFTGDAAGGVSGTAPNTTAASDPPYWSGSNTGSDAVSTALEYIPETAWNETNDPNNSPPVLTASGGGASIYFAKPSWQAGTGVPADGKRDVPDISLNAGAYHDPYLVCSEDFSATSCSSGFRISPGGVYTAVGGTSAAAPTFAAILALVNQYVGNPGTTGFAPVNPILYQLAGSNPSAFHDVTTGNNKVPCTAGSTDCPSGTTQIGFTAGPGYDQVTGLGSVDAFNFAQAYAATLPGFSVSAGAFNPSSVSAGASTTSTVTFTPQNGFTGTITPSCSGLPSGAQCSFNPTTVTGGSGSTTLTIQTAANTAAGTSTVTVKGASGSITGSTTVSLNVTATQESFTLNSSTAGGTLSVAQGQTTTAVNITVASTSTPSFVQSNGSGSSTALPLTYSCTGLPAEATCTFSPGMTNSSTTVSVTIVTTAPTGRLVRPLDRGMRFFYAVLLPGLLGIVFTMGGRKNSLRGARVLGLVLVLGVSSLWMASCSGTNGSGAKNLGTPTGSSTVTVTATTGGSAPLTSSFQFTLTVTP